MSVFIPLHHTTTTPFLFFLALPPINGIPIHYLSLPLARIDAIRKILEEKCTRKRLPKKKQPAKKSEKEKTDSKLENVMLRGGKGKQSKDLQMTKDDWIRRMPASVKSIVKTPHSFFSRTCYTSEEERNREKHIPITHTNLRKLAHTHGHKNDLDNKRSKDMREDENHSYNPPTSWRIQNDSSSSSRMPSLSCSLPQREREEKVERLCVHLRLMTSSVAMRSSSRRPATVMARPLEMRDERDER